MTAATIPLPDPYIGIAAFVDFAVAVEPVLPVVVPVPEAVVEREEVMELTIEVEDGAALQDVNVGIQ